MTPIFFNENNKKLKLFENKNKNQTETVQNLYDTVKMYTYIIIKKYLLSCHL